MAAQTELLVYALEVQLKLFREFWGRDPLPHEPVFFDPEIETVPTAISSKRFAELVRKGVLPNIFE